MFEAIKKAVTNYFHVDKFEELAETIFEAHKHDSRDNHQQEKAVQYLAMALRAYYRMKVYVHKSDMNALDVVEANAELARDYHPSKMNKKLCEELQRAGLIKYGAYKHEGYQVFGSHVVPQTKEGTYIYFPCNKLEPAHATFVIKHVVAKTLHDFYPLLYKDKMPLTLMCMHKFRPHSFFAKVPRDVIKIIAQYAKDTKEFPRRRARVLKQ